MKRDVAYLPNEATQAALHNEMMKEASERMARAGVTTAMILGAIRETCDSENVVQNLHAERRT